ncbi:MAG: hypothetical protein GX751_03010 [Desulfuromonadaceae bacterium]|nr:hypothetical protein [Desulfuromonadaceae bacterium]
MAILAAPVWAAPPFEGGPGYGQKGPDRKHNGKELRGSNNKRGTDNKGHGDYRKADKKGYSKQGSSHNVYRGKQRYFNDHHRVVVHDYYAGQYRRGHCPPGLAKKGYGCMPPGHAKKWAIGRPLPRSVIFHDLPPQVLVQLGPTPSRHRFVRVAEDILLIATGTGMVVDAIDNLSWEFGR